MRRAARLARRVVTFVDSPGAYPGIGAEERGQAEAIAANLELMAGLSTPIISIVIGDVGSGGALAIGVGNRVRMMEYCIYSAIIPDPCSSILYRSPSKADKAPHSRHLTA